MFGFVRDLKKVTQTVMKKGLRYTVGMSMLSLRARLMRLCDRVWEKSEGLSFNHRHVQLNSLTIESSNKCHGFSYVPCTAIAVKALLANVQADFSDYCFIDFGSGEGRSLIIASKYPFAEIIGVEFAKELHETALQNIQNANPDGEPSGRIRSVHMDAAQFEIPRRNCVLYFYNPFGQAVLRQVLANIERVHREFGTEMFIIFHQTHAALENNNTHNESLFRAAEFLTEYPIGIANPLTRFLMGSQQYYLFKTNTTPAGVASLNAVGQQDLSLLEV